MSDIIDFLEKLGQDAHLRHLADDSLEQVLIQADIDTGARAAILDEDSRRLEALLGAPATLCCLVEEPKREEEEEDDDDDEDEEEEEDPKVKRPRSALRHAAVAS